MRGDKHVSFALGLESFPTTINRRKSGLETLKQLCFEIIMVDLLLILNFE